VNLAGTHDGEFHADDVFSWAVISLLFPDCRVVRTRDPSILATADIRFDVGGKHDPSTSDYDHHQEGGAGFRLNGVPYASFGLIWQRYGRQFCDFAEHAATVDERLVQIIDAYDIGYDVVTSLANEDVVPYTVSKVIKAFNPPWHGNRHDKAFNRQFALAAETAKIILRNEITSCQGAQLARSIIIRGIAGNGDPRILMLEKFCPHEELLLAERPEVVFIVLPSDTGKNWMIRVVPEKRGSFKAKRYLPEAWAGKKDAEFQKLTEIPDAVFCHNSRFIAGVKSKESALQLATLALKW
jgi:uncharacterized UPF0160 family protein